MANQSMIAAESVAARIFVVRGVRVLLDADLAAMYGVATMRFNEAVKRNVDRFPEDFCFQLTEQEFEEAIARWSPQAILGLMRASPVKQ
jgi:hypothetical protein